VSGRDWIIDPQEIDTTKVVADLEEIRRCNRQRDAMEQLTAIVYDDPESNICIGYRDTSPEEFWVAGHMPRMPLMPGVLMCEAAAQVCSFHACRHDLLGGKVVGLGGLDNIRFRDTVVPGDRLTIVTKITKLRRGRMVVSRFQEFVETKLVCEGEIRAIPLPMEEIKS